jgi:hypothetical protein
MPPWRSSPHSPRRAGSTADAENHTDSARICNADVDENGNLSLYKVNCKIAFVVERGQS